MTPRYVNRLTLAQEDVGVDVRTNKGGEPEQGFSGIVVLGCEGEGG